MEIAGASIWLWVLIISGLLLTIVMLRSKIGWRWLPFLGFNVVVAAVLLYFADLAEPYTHVSIPINGVTIAAIAALGVPGVIMLAALKLVLF
ncbi:pro-sigmaK processing inhibitor BofA family protein [Paenibacillus thermotolerans]|uniref:pro-sigmaK processing inhibitor BofA family protein n=1 Tax=Paenibacillus thermotolerans TaxID=3027807 RepID=UPI0023676927|nr:MULTISPECIES: pro-sigmaK processing inhibitor BofA family protein [unclassified Paenibacillus]